MFLACPNPNGSRRQARQEPARMCDDRSQRQAWCGSHRGKRLPNYRSCLLPLIGAACMRRVRRTAQRRGLAHQGSGGSVVGHHRCRPVQVAGAPLALNAKPQSGARSDAAPAGRGPHCGRLVAISLRRLRPRQVARAVRRAAPNIRRLEHGCFSQFFVSIAQWRLYKRGSGASERPARETSPRVTLNHTAVIC